MIYTQTEILTSIRTLLAEPTAERWTDAQIYAAISMALQSWQGRVRVPYMYIIPGGFTSNTFDYTLPAYIDTRTIQPQIKERLDYVSGEFSPTWSDLLVFDVEPVAGSDRTVLRISSDLEAQARVLWWGESYPASSTSVLKYALTPATTYLVLTARPQVSQCGYIKIDGEWIQYAGTLELESNLVLLNLVRGAQSTVATSHAVNATVTWGVAMESPALAIVLYDAARMYLMQMWLMNTSSRETGQYEKQLVLFQNNIDRFWRGWRPSRPMRMRLSRMALGISNWHDYVADSTTATITHTYVLCDGDSLTYGWLVDSTEAYPYVLQQLLGTAYTVNNQGVGGQTLTQMEADAAADIDVRIQSGRFHYLLAWGGTNDLYYGDSAATAYADYVAYCTNRRAAGWTVIAFTILPRSDPGTPGSFETSRQTFNTNVRANWHQYADAVCDVASNPLIGDAGDNTNTTYYNADLVHLNAAGLAIVAKMALEAIRIIEAI